MGPKERGKKDKNKKSSAPRLPPPPPPPPPEEGSLGHSSPVPPPADAPPSSSSPQAPISEKSFSIFYAEGDLSWHFDCVDVNVLARTAVEEAMVLGLNNVCEAAEVNREQLFAFTSFPTSIGERALTVKEWLAWGKQPYITVCSKPKTGLLRQRDEAREELQQARDAREKLIREGLSSLGIEKTQECNGCAELKLSMEALKARFAGSEHVQEVLLQRNADLEKQRDNMATTINNLENGRIKDLELMVAAMIDRVQALDTRTSQILRRIVVQDARKEAVKRLGDKTKGISNYHEYFTARESETLALGMSPSLLNLLKDGTWGLNKAAHVAPMADKAHAVMKLDGAVRETFVEAFEFAYHESVDSHWSA